MAKKDHNSVFDKFTDGKEQGKDEVPMNIFIDRKLKQDFKLGCVAKGLHVKDVVSELMKGWLECNK